MSTAFLRSVRIRYLIAGGVMAVLWLGHAGEPAWAHAMRIALVLVTVRPLAAVTRRYYLRHWDSPDSQTRAILALIATRIAALVAAVVLGTLIERWITHQPYSAHLLTLLRLGLLLVTIPLQIRLLRSRRAGRAAAAAIGRVRWTWLLLAKAVLVGTALGAQVLLDMAIGRSAEYVVAAGLFAAVATLGPVLHSRLFGRSEPAVSPVSAAGCDEPSAPART